jgi:predicted amidohydrolase
VEGNLAAFDPKITQIAGSDLILLPEMFASGSILLKNEEGETRREIERTAACYEKIRERMGEWARQTGALVIGSTVYGKGEKFYNRMIAAFPGGTYGFYDKRHGFSMAGENRFITAGQRQTVLEFRGVKIALFICYDLRFPVWSRNTQGYDLAVYAANWPASRREAWNILLRARAVENQCYVAGVNCVGRDPGGNVYSGDSVLLNAKGEIVVACPTEEESLVTGELSPDELDSFRKKFPVLADRDHFLL